MMKYLAHYPQHLLAQIQHMADEHRVGEYLLSKYPKKHPYTTDKELFSYLMGYKNRFLKQGSSIHKVVFDSTIHSIEKALGIHTFISRVQGGRLKAKNEIRIASVFKDLPQEFLTMIVVHELAHLKEKEHNKSFYNLCLHMEQNYHQYEFDLRVYLTYKSLYPKLWEGC